MTAGSREERAARTGEERQGPGIEIGAGIGRGNVDWRVPENSGQQGTGDRDQGPQGPGEGQHGPGTGDSEVPKRNKQHGPGTETGRGSCSAAGATEQGAGLGKDREWMEERRRAQRGAGEEAAAVPRGPGAGGARSPPASPHQAGPPPPAGPWVPPPPPHRSGAAGTARAPPRGHTAPGPRRRGRLRGAPARREGLRGQEP